VFDIHFHALPNVDDGPDSMESALDLLAQAYGEGTNKIIITPHMNHYLKFVDGEINIRERFEAFKSVAKKVFPDLDLYCGAEIYISRKNIGRMEMLPIMSIEDTDYILVEFSRAISPERMDTILYELKLYKYKPIIAHIEVYEKLYKDLDRVIDWRKDGILIQVNADSFFSSDETLKKRSDKYMSIGVVDFVASDAHHAIKRPTKLLEGYKYIKSKYGRLTAERVCKDNPILLIEGEEIPDFLIRNNFFMNIRQIVLVAFVLAIVVSVLFSNSYKDQTIQEEDLVKRQDQTVSIKESGSDLENDYLSSISERFSPIMINEDGIRIEDGTMDSKIEVKLRKKEQTKGNQSKDEEILSDEVIPEELVDMALGKEKSVLTIDTSPTPTDEENFVNSYVSYFYELEGKYIGEVDRYFVLLKNAIDIEDEFEMQAALNSLLGDLEALEAEADNLVYKTLYDMQNDLEDKGYDVRVVQEIREFYIDVKLETSNRYESELKAYYKKVKTEAEK